MWHHRFLIAGIFAEACLACPAPEPLKALVYEHICTYLNLDDLFGEWHFSQRDFVLEIEQNQQEFRLDTFGIVRRQFKAEGERRPPPLFYGITCSGIAQCRAGQWRLPKPLECDDEILGY